MNESLAITSCSHVNAAPSHEPASGGTTDYCEIRCRCGLAGKSFSYHMSDEEGKLNAENMALEWWEKNVIGLSRTPSEKDNKSPYVQFLQDSLNALKEENKKVMDYQAMLALDSTNPSVSRIWKKDNIDKAPEGVYAIWAPEDKEWFTLGNFSSAKHVVLTVDTYAYGPIPSDPTLGK